MTVKKDQAGNQDYEVKLEIFEGPLDLLLHLIRKNEVDIFDIPIATVADQYLEYIDMMKALNVNVAGEFLVMASSLVHIKSKMLLPNYEGEEDEDDPRVEITRPLMEYLRLKEVAGELSERDLLDRDVFTRHLSQDGVGDVDGEEPLLQVSLFQLMDAFKRVLEQRAPKGALEFRPEPWSLKDKTTIIVERLKQEGAIYFSQLFDQDRTISEFVVTFLALLELVQIGLVRLFQTDIDKDIRLEAHFNEDEEEPDE
jgi:segregation and condensation protein A